MKQIARNLTDCVGGFLKNTRYLILDRDLLYARAFRKTLTDADVKVVRLSARSPNLNAFAERFVPSVKTECLDRMIPLAERHLPHLLAEYHEHSQGERNHQSLFLLFAPQATWQLGRCRAIAPADLPWALGPAQGELENSWRQLREYRKYGRRSVCLPGSPTSVLPL